MITWGFEEVLTKCNKKDTQADYVPYISNKVTPPCYQYLSPALLGEGTNFNLYSSALSRGLVVFDPGTKLMNASTEKPSCKPRSQFRISIPNLKHLYHQFEDVSY
ncbi:MAG: MvaI/BcnI family restriction endonuclease [Methylotenera sp.]|uniref:MvaI/BcnI family restriction endonuclease n=1 Tax=Methylotenera sp. TaxID=2051956 RepID=UPI00248898CC|nr:MvaI/BcnI family restriction endonuclease [Methylotenera sp.]MDI1308888.1 MvaI/BcnI family restriction endonuclease [Methylotenera sp.]